MVFADFRPLPLLANPHLQTVLGTWLGGPTVTLPTREHAVRLADDDRLVIHDTVPPSWLPGQRIAVLVHGLGGSHRSSHIQRLAVALLKQGMRVVRTDLRGCGRGLALARKYYHGGCSDDLRAAVAAVHGWSPTSPITLIGISLGGNIVLKLAGEAATDPVPGLARVAAIAPPIDLTRCAAMLAEPRNRIYEKHFVHQLVSQVRRQEQLRRSRPRFPRDLRLRQFDDLYTAPRWGFRDAADYYQQASSLGVLDRIQVPALLLTAADDPFIAVEPFHQLQAPGHVEVHILKSGGHLGFLGWDGAGGIRWAERRVTDWVLRHGH